MNFSYRQQIGKQFEQAALQFLKDKGLETIVQNYTCFFGEVDLIMRDREDIVFVEVRSRSRTDYGGAAETVTPAKQRKIIRTAIHFLQKRRWLYKVSSRFDIVAIQCASTTKQWQLEWIKNAFQANT